MGPAEALTKSNELLFLDRTLAYNSINVPMLMGRHARCIEIDQHNKMLLELFLFLRTFEEFSEKLLYEFRVKLIRNRISKHFWIKSILKIAELPEKKQLLQNYQNYLITLLSECCWSGNSSVASVGSQWCSIQNVFHTVFFLSSIPS